MSKTIVIKNILTGVESTYVNTQSLKDNIINEIIRLANQPSNLLNEVVREQIAKKYEITSGILSTGEPYAFCWDFDLLAKENK